MKIKSILTFLFFFCSSFSAFSQEGFSYLGFSGGLTRSYDHNEFTNEYDNNYYGNGYYIQYGFDSVWVKSFAIIHDFNIGYTSLEDDDDVINLYDHFYDFSYSLKISGRGFNLFRPLIGASVYSLTGKPYGDFTRVSPHYGIEIAFNHRSLMDIFSLLGYAWVGRGWDFMGKLGEPGYDLFGEGRRIIVEFDKSQYIDIATVGIKFYY